MGQRSKVLLLAALLLCLGSVEAQVTWQYSYGGYSIDEGNSVLVDANGNYLVVGSTGSFGAGGGDIYILLIDPEGAKIWSRTLGGIGVDEGRTAVQAEDGGYVIVGSTNSFGNGGYDGYVAKIGGDGELLWEHSYGGTEWDFLNSISTSPDGDYIVAGQTYSQGEGAGDAWVMKLDDDGIVQWEHTYGGAEGDFARCVIATADGGYMIAGAITTASDQNAWLVKLDAVGDSTWSMQAGGDSLDFAASVIQTADGGYAAVGSTRSYSVYIEALHFKVDETGVLQWLRDWGQVNNQETSDQVELSDGRLLSVGYVNTSGSGGKDMFIFFSSSDGDFISGISNGGNQGSSDESGASVAVVPSGGFIFCGYTESFGYGLRDVYLVKTDSVGLTQSTEVISVLDPLGIESRIDTQPIPIQPNPSAGNITISKEMDWQQMVLFDATGRAIRTWEHPGGQLDISDLADGTYFLRGTDRSHRTAVSPLILQKR